MKIFNYKFLIALMALNLSVVSCSKDDSDDEVVKSSTLTYDGTEYELEKGVIEDYGQLDSTGVYLLDLTLLSGTLNFNGDEFSGSGTLAMFEMYSSTTKYLSNGTYTFDKESEKAFTFSDAEFVINADPEMVDEETGWIEAKSGTINVQRNDSEYSITFSCITKDGKTITGTYNGLVSYMLGK